MYLQRQMSWTLRKLKIIRKNDDKLKKKENETYRPTIRGMYTFFYSLD